MSFPPKSEQLGLCCFFAEGGRNFEFDGAAVPDGRVQLFEIVEAVDVVADDAQGIIEVRFPPFGVHQTGGEPQPQFDGGFRRGLSLSNASLGHLLSVSYKPPFE
jgi:hypothetical protein